MPLIEQGSHAERLPSVSLQLKPRAQAVTAAPDRLKTAQRIVAKRLRDPQPTTMTPDESWIAVLDRCAKDFSQRKGLQPYLAAVAEGRKRKRRPPIWMYHRRRVRAITRLGMTFVDGVMALDDQVHRGLLVSVQLDQETAARLAVPGGEPAEDLHVTLCDCQDIDDLGLAGVQRAIDVVRAVVATQPPLEGRVGGIGRFHASAQSDGEDVIYASVDVPTLSAFRERLAAALRDQAILPREDHGFVPHITLTYIAGDAPSPIEGVPDVPLRFADVTVTVGSVWYVVPFGGGDA